MKSPQFLMGSSGRRPGARFLFSQAARFAKGSIHALTRNVLTKSPAREHGLRSEDTTPELGGRSGRAAATENVFHLQAILWYFLLVDSCDPLSVIYRRTEPARARSFIRRPALSPCAARRLVFHVSCS